MALLYTPQKKVKKLSTLTAEIIELDYQGLGVAKINGKTWFIENALPQEKVECRVLEEKRQYGRAVAGKWLEKSPNRVLPQCAYYERCGGCQAQHIPIEMQREAKQAALFKRLAKLQQEPIDFQPMICGEPWQYRRRVRLGLWFNGKSKKIEMGFRQKNSHDLIPVEHCEVIEPTINVLLPKLTALLAEYSTPKQLGHIELVAADNGVAMLLRYMGNLAKTDRSLLLNFAEQENLMLFLQSDEGIEQVCGEAPYYQFAGGIKLHFDIQDFIQVNRQLNETMVQTALDWLDLQPTDRVLDLFCGMGNFTLPLATRVKSAVGIEGVFEMAEKAKQNAARNQINNIEFFQANLDQSFIDQPWANRFFNKILLDPPRSGAAFALNALCELKAEKILYVSCNPATLVRDAEMLRGFGYKLEKSAVIDMFPHTGHLESITLFSTK
ncbi:23S rRNA (uracil(1939)-C(5))-methyltransferase RlmD [Rodentibacter trehalosifermentans]|uniref:23S rRNA (uracil(1939)-C(5))-methyltransferase RlmD n=1 Tax=Rodentibacter trehalosifermentans TaxID=1908263 RepID=A0A1V3J7X5_9PAST|nr:23S rRNA (uracil(1939)-C(5))-methyltransferase RlmD [Rodentibacter trehalosifermentans]OOF47092.1 23S rRNA methyltransferase [Rodentibacter trehalosifermentans]OOF51473.1 23S rRNA methyltransferase [Rodentibacter trehalosifermentans]OOF53027.1 23S rRNA methyltransferase [Rodentibacter trehalosifermentans]